MSTGVENFLGFEKGPIQQYFIIEYIQSKGMGRLTWVQLTVSSILNHSLTIGYILPPTSGILDV